MIPCSSHCQSDTNCMFDTLKIKGDVCSKVVKSKSGEVFKIMNNIYISLNGPVKYQFFENFLPTPPPPPPPKRKISYDAARCI
jgi:hypothetical protein